MIRKKRQQQKQTTQPSHSSVAPVEQTFIEHIRELRSRLFWVVTSLLIASSIGFMFKDVLVAFILAPLHGEKLVYLTIGGGFSFIFTVCLYFGAVVSIPVTIYHLYRFLQPVLGSTSRRLIVNLMLSSAGLAIAGAAFGYFIAIQASISFLMNFAEGAITSSVTAESYMNFVIAYTAGLALVFQLPLLLFIFDHIRPFKPGALLSSQRFVITGAVIAAALITPTPDVVNQMIIAIPIIAIYQVGVLIVYFRHRAQRRVDTPKAKQHVAATEPLAEDEIPDSVIDALVGSRTELKNDSDFDAEIAAAFGEELESEPTPVATVEPKPVQPVVPTPMNHVVIQPKVTIPVTEQPQMQFQPQPQSQQTVRSIDGMSRISSQARVTRPAPSLQPVRRSTTVPQRSLRTVSIDGFSVI